MKRRTFIKSAAGTGLAAGAGVFGILKYPRGANAAGWGQWPSDRTDLLIPEDMRPQNVLEVTFHGGFTPWETFYSVPEWGQANNTYLNLFEDEPVNSSSNFYDNVCQYGDTPYTTPFAEAGGETVSLGPWVRAFKQRPDILERMRVVVTRHSVLAHEGANPLAFTGFALGNPRAAGIGASIQRYFSEQPGGARSVPYSYVLYPGGEGLSAFNVSSASAIGFHPGSARPLNVTVSQDSQLAALLARPGLAQSDPEMFDAAVSHYQKSYENRFRPQGVGKATRSLERSNYDFANFARQNANDLIEVLPPALFAEIQGQTCANGAPAIPTQNLDMPAMMARVARSLLTRPDNQARYVNWVDTGIFPRPEVGYDVHNEHVLYTSRSVPHTLEQIANSIRDPNNPQPNDDELLDLDRTMIVLNMEFGRTPYRQVAGSSGTNHWPYGYVNVVIGGPIRPDDSRSPSSSIYGYIQEADGYAQEFATPAENRIMMLTALGIYPFTSQTFAVADVRFANTEPDCITRVRDELWGLSV